MPERRTNVLFFDFSETCADAERTEDAVSPTHSSNTHLAPVTRRGHRAVSAGIRFTHMAGSKLETVWKGKKHVLE
jgi:hypothetical protein